MRNNHTNKFINLEKISNVSTTQSPVQAPAVCISAAAYTQKERCCTFGLHLIFFKYNIFVYIYFFKFKNFKHTHIRPQVVREYLTCC